MRMSTKTFVVLAALTFFSGLTPANGAFLGLSSLSIAAPHELNPAFSPETQKYSVLALDGVDQLTMTATTISPDQVLMIEGAVVASGDSVAVTAPAAGGSIGIEVASADRSRSVHYQILYLPSTFPKIEVTVKESGVSHDFLYLGILRSGAGPSHIAIVDNNGVPVYYAETPQGSQPRDFKRHPNSLLSYFTTIGVNEFGRPDYERTVMTEAFEEIGRYRTVDLSHTDTHDFLILDNGHFLFLSYDGVFRDLSCCGGDPMQFLEDTVVQEVDPGPLVPGSMSTPQAVFEWRSWGFIPLEDRLRPATSEYAHGNSLHIDTDGNILLSLRGVSQVVKIDRVTGLVLWKLGGLSNEFTIDDPLGSFCGQHTVTRLANGNLLIFDNGQFCPFELDPPRGEVTRAAEYEIDEGSRTAKLVWSYSRPGAYTVSQGSAQRLGNGNTLIGWGRGPDVSATEVDAEGRIVFEMAVRYGTSLSIMYRVQRFAGRLFSDGFEAGDLRAWSVSFHPEATSAGRAGQRPGGGNVSRIDSEPRIARQR